MRKKRIFKKSLAIELMKQGCNLVDVEQNNRNKNLMVYIFEQNEKLLELLGRLRDESIPAKLHLY
ncbi:DUF5659 domain-containing protein [Bacillus cereus group sp. BfR-BA-01383]|uniref:DUF5659 domain-containing protein n=1 Tax=Bacillus cereus group sp. BfR-BA-01383 TaxID=2920327 RepID=UPI001F5734E6|nr:DUF5659 domain-containing protein [Bacillus cereus group sp. BfR-BA-01383]